MKRFLTKENKRSLRESLEEDDVYRVINAAWKEEEMKMESLHFSPEEIWLNCFEIFDRILRKKHHIKEITDTLWIDTYCDLRDETEEEDRTYKNDELDTATSCIIYVVLACLMASGDYELIRHTESLMMQISDHSDLNSITLLFDCNIDDEFVSYIKEYISRGKYISNKFDNPKSSFVPFKRKLTAKVKIKAIEDVRERLKFMSGVLPDSGEQIMTQTDYNKMLEGVEYLMENNVIKKQNEKIITHLQIAHLRYTFYLAYKNEGNFIERNLWLGFLTEAFSQMQNNNASLSKHFSDVPTGYDSFLKNKK